MNEENEQGVRTPQDHSRRLDLPCTHQRGAAPAGKLLSAQGGRHLESSVTTIAGQGIVTRTLAVAARRGRIARRSTVESRASSTAAVAVIASGRGVAVDSTATTLKVSVPAVVASTIITVATVVTSTVVTVSSVVSAATVITVATVVASAVVAIAVATIATVLVTTSAAATVSTPVLSVSVSSETTARRAALWCSVSKRKQ